MAGSAWKPVLASCQRCAGGNVPDPFGNIAILFALGLGLRLCRHHWELFMALSRNLLAVLVLILVAALAVTGYSLYQEKKQPDGVEISVGKNGLSIKEK